jgi:hypothetical protein
MRIRELKLARAFFVGLIWLGLISFGYGAVPEKIKSEIELARENLRISEATAERIAAELEELNKSGQASPEIINDYEIYLARVQAMVNENRKIVRGMEAAYAGHLPREKSTSPDASEDLGNMLNPKIPEEQPIDELAALDREFNNSLGEFDEMLLKEFDAIRARSAKKMWDLAEEAAEAAKRLREKGVELNTSESDSSSDTEEGVEDGGKKADAKDTSEEGERKADAEKEVTDKENGSESEEGVGDKEVATRDKSKEGGQGSSQEQEHRYDEEDDDIVARQLREAAENETDPELKEKLWKEYEEYKKNTR